MTQKYEMRTANSCGPDAFAFAAQHYQDVIDRAWHIDDINRFHNLKDSPWHHFVVAESIGISFQVLTLAQVLAGDFTPCKALALIHMIDDPKTIEPESLTRQHWIVLVAVTAGYVHFYDGEHDTPRRLSVGLFSQMYAAGSPACIYELGRGEQKTTWYQRLYVWLTNKVFGG